MIKFLVKKFKEKKKKEKKKKLIDSFFLVKMLGQLTRKGNKNLSYFILSNVLLELKKLKKNKKRKVKTIIKPSIMLSYFLDIYKPTVLLLNKRKGTVIFELPRFINIIQSYRKIVEWLIKVSKKWKRDIIRNIVLELKKIFLQKGEVLKKKFQILQTIRKNKPFYYLLRKRKRKIKIKIKK